MPAVPVVVTISTTVSSVLAISMLTGTTAIAAFGYCNIANRYCWYIVVFLWLRFPLGSVLLVLPLVTVPSTVKVSSTSSIVSSVVGIVTFTLVLPAGIVTVVVVSV